MSGVVSNKRKTTAERQQQPALAAAPPLGSRSTSSSRKRLKQRGMGEFLDPPRLNLLLPIPNDVFTASILSFLGPNDTTNLALTSRGMLQKVNRLLRNGKPCILWQVRLPTRIVYDGTDEDLCTISQRQPFQFLVQEDDGQRIRVEVRLVNEAWQEDCNMRDGSRCHHYQRRRPLPTKYRVVIYSKREDGTWGGGLSLLHLVPRRLLRCSLLR